MVCRRQFLNAVALLPAIVASASRAAGRASPSALGYLPWWMAGGWRTISFKGLDRLALFDTAVQESGALLDRDWARRAPGLAPRPDLPIDLTLTVLDERLFETLFGDPSRRQRLLEQASGVLEDRAISGLHLDVEGYGAVKDAAIDGFRSWLEALDERRRKLGKGLSAFFPASDVFSPYDTAASQRLDYWVAQLYDAHWPQAPVTGPLVTRSPQNPVGVPRALTRLAKLGVAPHKVLLSVPLYGWQWPSESDRPGSPTLGRARLLTYARTPPHLMPNDRLAATVLAQAHGLRRDAEHTPYYAHRDGTTWVQGWFEDAESLRRKFAVERAQGYAGLAFFTLGYDQGAMVDSLLRWWSTPQR